MTNRNIIIFLLIVSISIFIILLSSLNRAKFSPDILPIAYINKDYKVKINILMGAVIENSFKYEISNKNFKLEPKTYLDVIDKQNSILRKDYEELTLTGIPTTLEPITIHISGSTYGTNFSGKNFEKTYILEVKEK